jgi:predicted lipase
VNVSYRYIKKLGVSKRHILPNKDSVFPLCGHGLTGAWIVLNSPVWTNNMDKHQCESCKRIWQKAQQEQEQPT